MVEVGRRRAGRAWLFSAGWLNATTQTVMWCVIFFFASTGASSAYLTISEVFPLEECRRRCFFGYLVKFPAHGPLAAGYLAAGRSPPSTSSPTLRTSASSTW